MSYDFHNENRENNLKMAVRNRFYIGGRESFYQSAVLFENDAARFARASFFDLFERNY